MHATLAASTLLSLLAAHVSGTPVAFSRRDGRMLTRQDVSAAATPQGTVTTAILSDGNIVNTGKCVPGDMVHSNLFNFCHDFDGCTDDTQMYDCSTATDTIMCTVTQEGNYLGNDNFASRNFFEGLLEQASRSLTTNQTVHQTVGECRRDVVEGRTPPDSCNELPTVTVFSSPANVKARRFITPPGGNSTTTPAPQEVSYTIQCVDNSASSCSQIMQTLGLVGGLAIGFGEVLFGETLDAALPGISDFFGTLSDGC